MLDTKKSRYKKIIGCVIFLLFFLAAGIFFKFIIHEKNQSNKINDLENKVGYLESLYSHEDEARQFVRRCELYAEEGVNYLAIGNSITLHPIVSYWWSECGMAATSKDKDYFHLNVTELEKKYKKVNAKAVTYLGWEQIDYDRSETFGLIERYLNEYIDIITIQLGENASDLTSFESDFDELLKFIIKHAPKSKIIVIGDFWEYKDRDKIKERVTKKNLFTFISLEDIKDDESFMCGMDTTVYGDDGAAHNVEHSGVAKHPNDKAMKYISDAVMEVVLDQ